MKKLTVLLLAAVLLCTCFALAACSGDEDTSSAPDASSTTDTSSVVASSAAESSKAEESSAVVEESSEPEESSAPETSEEEPAEPEAKLFWLTHYNSTSNEGSGVVISEEYTGGQWWFHASFAPVEGEDGVYEVVEVLDGTDGSGHELAIPEGGFVYALHTGNNYEDGIDYTTEAGTNMLNEARTWKKGDKFTFTGIDFDNFEEVPTETPDLNWYEDGDRDYGNYVCTATYTKVG